MSSSLLTDRESNHTVLYENYSDRWFWWEAFILVRRFVISMISIIAPRGGWREFMIVLACLAALSLSWIARPFRDAHESALELTSMSLLVGIAAASQGYDAGTLPVSMSDVIGWVSLMCGCA
jgi:hypothetical protein